LPEKKQEKQVKLLEEKKLPDKKQKKTGKKSEDKILPDVDLNEKPEKEIIEVTDTETGTKKTEKGEKKKSVKSKKETKSKNVKTEGQTDTDSDKGIDKTEVAAEEVEAVAEEVAAAPEAQAASIEKEEPTARPAVEEEKKPEEVIENYEQLTKEQLVELLEATVKEPDVTSIKTKIALIKVAFLKINKIEKDRQLEKYIAEGGVEEDYSPPEDQLEERFKLSFSIYKQNKAKYNQEQEKLKQDNLEKKKQILEELKVLISSEETLKKTYDEFKILQGRWKEIGMVPQGEINNLWQSYHFLVEKFFDKVKINKELRDLDLKKNLESKIKLCEKTEELLLETSILKSFKQLQKYHEEWKEIGPVANDKKDEIWERFKAATDKINERRREHYAKLYEDQKNNYEAKSVLCDKAEKLITIESSSIKEWQDHTEQMNELFKIWRTIGPTPKKQNDEIWQRFKSSMNTFFTNKKEYFVRIKEQQVNNYNLKIDLCVQAEALKNNTDWKKTTREMINLQKEWKNTGPVPRKNSDKIWKRFRAACDEFFNSKSEYYANIQDHEVNNLKLKQELIQKVEDYKFGEDKKENLKVIKEFQREWMDIGHVPIKEKEKLQNEFRLAVDKHLDNLKISSTEISTLNYKTRIEAMKDSQSVKNFIFKERNFISNKISKLREDVNLWENNIGFLTDTINANILKAEFEKKINKAKQNLTNFEAKLKVLVNFNREKNEKK
ncbi:MAG: DUF349 domain-containing protein, partial [Bacteroidales bacterium]|nr:DUF349 domain-containing protein [Bacteroidales bacterium]